MRIRNIVLLTQLIVALLVCVGTYFAIVDLPYFEGFYVREDGPIEWLTFVAHLSTFSVCIWRLLHYKGRFFTLFNMSLVLIALIFFFGAGEEISWGQRIFGLQSPEFFLRHNSQGEINIHNLILGDLKVNRLIFGTIKGIVVAIYFLIVPILYGRFNWIKNLLNACAIPIPDIPLILFYLFMAALVWALPGGKTGELLEFLGGWVFFMLILTPKNRYAFLASSNSNGINTIAGRDIQWR